MRTMRTFSTIVLAMLVTGSAVRAQVKTIPGESVSASARIEAIEQRTRTLTIKNDDGTYETLQVPQEVKRFSELKVGDRITVRFYDNVVVRLKKPGEAAIEVEHEALTRGSGKSPSGTAASQLTVTVSVVAIDPKVPSITVKGPNGWTYSRKVEDRKALAQVKVGDTLDITWTEAVLISVDPAK
jgi:ribosomal 50S subunit-recycling heat shock protein